MAADEIGMDPEDGLGAKAAADSGSEQVPQRYVRSEETRLCASSDSSGEIPVIDLKCFFEAASDPEAEEEVVKQIADACQTYGFFQIINHGVPESIVSRLFEVAHGFFDLPPEEKQSYAFASDKWRNVVEDPYGLFRYGVSFKGGNPTLDWRDWVRFEGTMSNEHDAFPKNPPSFREAGLEYERALSKVDELLLRLISRGLGLDQNFLWNALGSRPYNYVLLNCYPACPAPSLVAGLSSHSDPLLLTVLAQEQISGLEILHNDNWIRVKPIPQAFVINLGDLMQIFTNGKYKSPNHRVRANSEKLRISMARFLGPSHATVIEPIQELLTPENKPLYRACTCGEYMRHFYTLKLQGKSCLEYVTI